jgi:3-isopropylmalate/(R)-2-methylmalate dehydratase small subunit
MKNEIISGKAFVVGDDIDTDQIIPAQYLVFSLDDPEEKKNYGKFALAGVPPEQSGLPQGNIPFVRKDEFRSEYTFIVAGKNFGGGSSREHAPVALEVAGIRAVIARSYARIFYRNAIDGAFLTPYETDDDLHKQIHTGDIIHLNTASGEIVNENHKGIKTYTLKSLGEVGEILRAGGIFEYARKSGMLKRVEIT